MPTLLPVARRAFTLPDLAALMAAIVAGTAITIPALSSTRGVDLTSTSLDRLRKLGLAQVAYAADFDGRQYTNTVDDITSYGPSLSQAFSWYESTTGSPHPPVVLGDDDDGTTWAFRMEHAGNYVIGVPFDFNRRYGWFRLGNARPLHGYVDGKFYSRTYYAPGDAVVWETVAELLDDPAEFVHTGSFVFQSSYALSPAALVDPEVMRRRDLGGGGWRSPFDLMYGYRVPGLFQARYPDLKTFILEHHWTRTEPADPCNPCYPDGTYEGCEPYYFNHGAASAPATLFYDLSARTVPVAEAIASDAAVTDPFEGGLWKRDTPAGDDGYMCGCSFDSTYTSFHILTTDGILGRDVIRRSPQSVQWRGRP